MKLATVLFVCFISGSYQIAMTSQDRPSAIDRASSSVVSTLRVAEILFGAWTLIKQYHAQWRHTDCYRVYYPSQLQSTFQNIIGHRSTVDFLRCSAHLLAHAQQKKPLQPPSCSNILLAGDSGTGKTLLAYATAHESGCPLIVANGHELAAHPVRIRGLFSAARRYAPCTLVIENLEVMARSRERFHMQLEEEQAIEELAFQLSDTHTTLLSSPNFIWPLSLLALHIPWLQSPSKPFLVIGTTCQPDWVDSKLLQSTRFAHLFKLPALKEEERKKLLTIQAQQHALSWTDDTITHETQGFTPAELAMFVRTVKLVTDHNDNKNTACKSWQIAWDQAVSDKTMRTTVAQSIYN